MAATTPSQPAHLDPSPLGTKEYWDNLYTREITNYAQDPTDEGTIWFDDSAAEDKVIAFLHAQVADAQILGEETTKATCSFLDLGTGNGHFLFRLREGSDDDEDEAEGETAGAGTGWTGRMLGVDYSERSVAFATQIAQERSSTTQPGRPVEFRCWDIMTQAPEGVVLEGTQAQGWDVVLDKGTFDAISLSGERDAQGRRVAEGYRARVVPLVRDGGILVVTSCNWTEEELREWFVGGGEEGAESELEFVERVRYPAFSFGGRKGQTISSVCFRRRARRS